MKKYTTAGLQLGKDPRPYTYKVPVGMILNMGDTVVVEKAGHPAEGTPSCRTVCVVEVHEHPQDTDASVEYQWIVDKVEASKWLGEREPTYEVLPCVREYPGNDLFGEISQALAPVAPSHVRRPEPDEEPEFWGVYRNEDNGRQLWMQDCDTEEGAKQAAKELNNER